ncbi:alpha-N-acetylgalactosaminidase-like [Liolophura sinensis]|uniref:alpha-N-acetylgalactosaminidase-like n=1 Tax=Liolophura sinensis TaxID=3198878 RepID=UPI0031586A63
MLLLASLCVASLVSVQALDNGLALTPPMGWLNWERFRCNIDCENFPNDCIREELFMQMADIIASEGYKDAGYEYVNIDDCWLAEERDANGRLQPDPDRFPSGIPALAKYIHGKGLKIGIYQDFGVKTCGGYPGSEFYMPVDAQTFADWQIDYVKFDGCNSDVRDFDEGYTVMSRFLNLTGRPMVFSCEWPDYQTRQGIEPNYTAIRSACNLWRNHDDIQDSWQSLLGIINFYGEDTYNFSSYAGPGGWNDPDMVIVGDFGLSYDQQRVQMAMWAIMASPMLMSVDLRHIRPESKALLQNRNVLSINQDPMGIQGKRIMEINPVQIWTRPISPKGTFAVAFLNPSEGGMPSTLSVVVDDLGLTNGSGYNVTETFDGVSMGTVKPGQNITISVNPEGVYLFTATPL